MSFDVSANLSRRPVLTLWGPYSSSPEKSTAHRQFVNTFRHLPPLQLLPAYLTVTTNVKSAAHPMGPWRFKESLPLHQGALHSAEELSDDVLAAIEETS
jgi:hypothetical protein